MRALLLALALAACGDFGTPLAAAAAPVSVHTEADMIACARVPAAYCQIVDERVLKIGAIIKPVAYVTIDCNRRGLFLPTVTGVQITNAKGVTVTQCHFASGSTLPHCLHPAHDTDLTGCPVGIDVRGASSAHIYRNTFAGPAFGKFVSCWRYVGDAAEPDCEIDHDRFRDAWYGVLAGAYEGFTGAQLGPQGHVSFHNNYSLRIFRRTLRIAAYTADASANFVQDWGVYPGQSCGWAFSALGGATLTVTANHFQAGPCPDPLDDTPTTLPKAPLDWGPGVLIAKGNLGLTDQTVSTLGGAVTVARGGVAPAVSAFGVEADIHANAGVPQ